MDLDRTLGQEGDAQADHQGTEGMMRSPARALLPLAVLLLSLLAACTEQEAPDCPIDAGPCSRIVEGVTVTFDLVPKPVRAMRELEFSVLLAKDGDPVVNAAVTVDLTMPGMDMGENRIRLMPRPGGRYAGKGVIVRCPSGSTLWRAAVIIDRGGRAATAAFLFEVK
jgi:hypothetical protein